MDARWLSCVMQPAPIEVDELQKTGAALLPQTVAVAPDWLTIHNICTRGLY
jgi:hypothetical protein